MVTSLMRAPPWLRFSLASISLSQSLWYITLTLPTAVGITGKVFTVKRNYSGGSTTVIPTGSETIDGGTSFELSTDGESFGFVSDGSNWHIIN